MEIRGAAGRARGRLRAWLDGRRAVWGELRYQIYSAVVGFSLTFLAVGLVLGLTLIPAKSVFIYGERTLSGVDLRLQILLPYFGVVLLMTAIIYFYLVNALLIPVERMRRRLQANRGAAAQADAYDRRQVELLEVAVQSAQRQHESSQAVILQQGETLRRREREVQQAGQRRRALMDALGEPFIEVDGDLRITLVSPAAAQLLHSSSGVLIDKPLFEAVRLFDADKSDWLSHPLNTEIMQVFAAESAAPFMFETLLLASRNQETRLTLMVMPYGGTLQRSGGVLRFIGEDGKHLIHSAAEVGGPSTIDADSGLPNNIAFRRRITELIERARVVGGAHTAAIFLVGGMRDEDDPTDFHRHVLSQVLARNLHRSVSGEAEVYRIGAIAFGVLKVDAKPDSLRDLFETIRALCQLELSREVSGEAALTVRFAATDFNAHSEGVDVVMEALVAQMTTRIAVGAPATREAGVSEGELLAERARWVSERLLDKLHLVSQSVLPAAAQGSARPWLEVFARIEDNDGHWLEPVHFLKAVEYAGEMGRLDAAVFAHVIAASKNTPDLLARYEGISFNVSAQSLSDDHFLNTVIEQLRSSDIDAARLAIEIDHRAIQLPAEALAGLSLLRSSGLRTIVDGCNDLRSLRLMTSIQPFLVKLSGDLIAAAEHDSVIGAELNAIISSAKVLGVQLSAKNVGSTGQLQKLTELGIDYAQGSGLEALGPILI